MTDGLIDVHAHFTTEDYIRAATAAGHREADGMPESYWPHWTVEDHLALMTDAGIDRALLSISSPGVYFGDAAAARQLARQVNQAAVQIKRAHPDRFGYFASLPLPDIDGALDEIDHAFADGADGVIWMTNAAGHYLGDPKVAPVLAELERRAAVVFLHPTSCAGHEALALGRPRPMVEFLFDTARTVIDFILSGAAHRYPQLRLIVPHAGGVLPLLADRLELFRALAENPHGPSVSEQLHRFYYDLAGTPPHPRSPPCPPSPHPNTCSTAATTSGPATLKSCTPSPHSTPAGPKPIPPGANSPPATLANSSASPRTERTTPPEHRTAPPRRSEPAGRAPNGMSIMVQTQSVQLCG